MNAAVFWQIFHLFCGGNGLSAGVRRVRRRQHEPFLPAAVRRCGDLAARHGDRNSRTDQTSDPSGCTRRTGSQNEGNICPACRPEKGTGLHLPAGQTEQSADHPAGSLSGTARRTGRSAAADRLDSVRTLRKKSGAGKIFPEQLVHRRIVPQSTGGNADVPFALLRIFSRCIHADVRRPLSDSAIHSGGSAETGGHYTPADL